jgi:hypothetical protein
LLKGKAGYRMTRGTGTQDKRIQLMLPDIPYDLLPGFIAAEKRMFRTMPDL